MDSWRDKDAPELDHELVIWNAAQELIRQVDSFVAQIRTDAERVTGVPGDVLSAVASLRVLCCICRALASKDTEIDGWDKLGTDIELTLHDFRFRSSAEADVPPFYSPARKKQGGKRKIRLVSKKQGSQACALEGKVTCTSLVDTFQKTPKLEPEMLGNVLADRHSVVARDKIIAQLHERAVSGQVLSVQEDLLAVMVHHEGFSSFEDEFVPLDELRLHVSGGDTQGAEIVPSILKLGMVVFRLDHNREEYISVVKQWRRGTFYQVCFQLGRSKFQRWIPRDCIRQLILPSEAPEVTSSSLPPLKSETHALTVPCEHVSQL